MGIRIRGRSSKLRTLLNEIDAAAAVGYYFPYLQAFVYLTSSRVECVYMCEKSGRGRRKKLLTSSRLASIKRKGFIHSTRTDEDGGRRKKWRWKSPAQLSDKYFPRELEENTTNTIRCILFLLSCSYISKFEFLAGNGLFLCGRLKNRKMTTSSSFFFYMQVIAGYCCVVYWVIGVFKCMCRSYRARGGGSKNGRAMTQLDLRSYITIVRGRLPSIYKASVGA
jgi:hypothetical protein